MPWASSSECLFNELPLDISELRFNSMHVFSNMADWFRKQLLLQNTQRFLKQVRHHENTVYRTTEEQIDLDIEKVDPAVFQSPRFHPYGEL